LIYRDERSTGGLGCYQATEAWWDGRLKGSRQKKKDQATGVSRDVGKRSSLSGSSNTSRKRVEKMRLRAVRKSSDISSSKYPKKVQDAEKRSIYS
jgi:hypothetical protein